MGVCWRMVSSPSWTFQETRATTALVVVALGDVFWACVERETKNLIPGSSFNAKGAAICKINSVNDQDRTFHPPPMHAQRNEQFIKLINLI